MKKTNILKTLLVMGITAFWCVSSSAEDTQSQFCSIGYWQNAVVEEVKRLGADQINQRCYPDYRDTHRAIHMAFAHAPVLVLKELLKIEKLHIDAVSREGWTPFTIFYLRIVFRGTPSTSGEREVAKLLIERGIDVNAGYGWTHLGIVAHSGDREIAELLIERGALLDAATSYTKWTPLMIAAMEGHITVVQLLIERGADVYAKDDSGKTALFWAEASLNLEIAEIIRKAMQQQN